MPDMLSLDTTLRQGDNRREDSVARGDDPLLESASDVAAFTG
jgi:hypothetical protein